MWHSHIIVPLYFLLHLNFFFWISLINYLKYLIFGVLSRYFVWYFASLIVFLFWITQRINVPAWCKPSVNFFVIFFLIEFIQCFLFVIHQQSVYSRTLANIQYKNSNRIINKNLNFLYLFKKNFKRNQRYRFFY